MQALRGVYTILSTPFRTDEELDEQSLRRLTGATLNMGVDGITILGVAGEAQKLPDSERRRVLEIVMEVKSARADHPSLGSIYCSPSSVFSSRSRAPLISARDAPSSSFLWDSGSR